MSTNIEHLQHVEDTTDGTAAINALKEEHDDLDIRLGEETGGLGTWFEFFVEDEVMVVLDYFGHPEHEGATFYVHPSLLK